MSDLNTFLAMGGYAVYVWPAYGITAIVLLAIWVHGLRRSRAVSQAFRKLEQQQSDAS